MVTERRPWPQWAFRVGFGVLAFAVIAGWLLWPNSEPVPFTKPARFNGLDVTVDYVGSACQSDSRLEIDEEASRVVLTVHTSIRRGSCDDVGVPYTVTGRLTAELGARSVVDGACELASKRQYPDCANP